MWVGAGELDDRVADALAGKAESMGGELMKAHDDLGLQVLSLGNTNPFGALVLCFTLTSHTTPTSLLGRWEQSMDEVGMAIKIHLLYIPPWYKRSPTSSYTA